jgi:glycine/D-amino acid oxidase-like deaminating enzyme
MEKSTLTLSPLHQNEIEDLRVEPLELGSHIIVFGAGAFGGWSALMLLEQGYKVTIVDPWGAGNSRSSSGGESRLIRMVYGDNALYTELALRSYTLWEKYQKTFKKDVLVPTGNLWFCDEHDPTIAAAMKILDANNLPYKNYNGKLASKIYPQINFSDVHDVLLEEKTGFLYAREATQSVFDLFIKKGGRFLASALHQTAAFDNSDKVRMADNNLLHADRYIFACGPWLPTIFPHWLKPKLTVTRQEIFYFGCPAENAYTLQALPTWIDNTAEAHYYGVPNTANRGFKLAADIRGANFDPTHGERIPTTSEVAKARDYLAHRFPVMANAPLLEARVCQYTNTFDGNFIFQPHPELPKVMALGGGSGHGFKHGPAVGELVANIISGKAAIPGAWL